MEQAALMLTKTNLTCEQTGWDCGFISYHYFKKVFEKYYGMSPAKYRVAGLAPKMAEAEFKKHYGMSPARYRVACLAPKTVEAEVSLSGAAISFNNRFFYFM